MRWRLTGFADENVTRPTGAVDYENVSLERPAVLDFVQDALDLLRSQLGLCGIERRAPAVKRLRQAGANDVFELA